MGLAYGVVMIVVVVMCVCVCVCVCVCACVLFMCMRALVRVWVSDSNPKSNPNPKSALTLLTLVNPNCCSVHAAVESGTPGRCGRVLKKAEATRGYERDVSHG